MKKETAMADRVTFHLKEPCQNQFLIGGKGNESALWITVTFNITFYISKSFSGQTVNYSDLAENVHTKALVFMNIPPGQSDLASDKIRNQPRNQLSHTEPRVRPGLMVDSDCFLTTHISKREKSIISINDNQTQG